MYSEWLQVMLGEIARKREEHESAERERRARIADAASSPPTKASSPAESKPARA